MLTKSTCNEAIALDPIHYDEACNRLNKLPSSIKKIHRQYTIALDVLLNIFFEKVHLTLFNTAEKTTSAALASQLFDDSRTLSAQQKQFIQNFSQSVSIAFSQIKSSQCALEQLCNNQNFSANQLDAFNQTETQNALIIARLHTHIKRELSVKNQIIILKPKGLGALFGQQISHLPLCTQTKAHITTIFNEVIINALGHIYTNLDQQLSGYSIPSEKNIDKNHPAKPISQLTTNKQHAFNNQYDTNITQLLDNIFSIAKISNTLSEEEQLSILNAAQKELLSTSSEEILDNIITFLEHTQTQLKIIGKLPNHTTELIKLSSITFTAINQNKYLDAKIKRCINRLLIPTIKTTLIDKQFFIHSNHPLRVLLNEISTFGLGWQHSEDPTCSSHIIKTIDRITTNLCLDFDSNTHIFSLAVIELKKHRAQEEKQLSLLNLRLLTGVQGKKLADDAENIATITVEAELTKLKPSAVVCVFAKNLWQKVLTVTALRSGINSTQWKQHTDLLQELCHLATPCQSNAEKNKRIKRLPIFMANIQQNLALCAHNLFDAEEIVEFLSQTLGECLKGKVAEQVFTLKNSHLKERPNPKNITKVHQYKSIGTLKESELREPSYQQPAEQTPSSLPSKEDHKTINTSNPLSEGQQIDDSALELKVLSLTRGMQFDWHDPNKGIIRCRLAAVIKQTNNYIFINRNGIKIFQLSLNETLNAFKEKKLTPIENDNAVYDTALEEVVSGMRRDKGNKISGNY